MKFSIIIPVFNVNEYLQKCIDSVLPAVKEDELILSLGNSTDGSTELCYHFANKYNNIKIVHQSGKGLSNARNCAIQQAHGEYIICIDSDDYVNTKLLSDMLDQIRCGRFCEDLIVHDFYRFERKTDSFIPVFQIGNIPDQSGLDFLPTMLRKRQCFWNVWRYIYRRQFLLDNNIIYRENTLSEDVDYTARVLMAEPSIRFVHCPFYVYTVGRGDSLMDLPTLKRLTDTISVLTDTIHLLNTSRFVHAPIIAAQLQFEYLLNLALTVEIDKSDRLAAIALYQNWKQVILPTTDPAVQFFSFVLSIIGHKAVAYVLHWIKLIRRFLRRNLNKRRLNT